MFACVCVCPPVGAIVTVALRTECRFSKLATPPKFIVSYRNPGLTGAVATWVAVFVAVAVAAAAVAAAAVVVVVAAIAAGAAWLLGF